jgi:1-acyl-sn-glycerol-3-phosphate acyltransferase
MIRRWLRCGGRAAFTTGAFTRGLAAALWARDASVTERAAAIAQVFASLARRHGLTMEVAGDVPQGPCVLVSNHVSYLDPIALLPLVPALPISKGEVGRWPLLGAGARATGVLFVDRDSTWSGARVLLRTLAVLDAGGSVLNFPEGTTTDGTSVLPFRRGIFGAARRARVPIVPVALAYPDPESAWTGDQTFAPHYLRTAAKERIHVRVAFAGALWPAERPAEELAAEARRRILALLERDHHVAADRVRVPETRPDPVLSAAVG